MNLLAVYFFELLLLCVVIWAKHQIPRWTGILGEKYVSNGFRRELDEDQYKIIDNILLPSEGNTKTTQIDQVIVSNFGIFCIETKAYGGWIYGNANSQYWKQSIHYREYRVYNPLRQNFAHVKALEKLILPLYPSVKINSFVSFPAADKIIVHGTDQVGWSKEILGKIKAFDKQILSDAERDGICAVISKANITDRNIRKEHDAQARELKNACS